MGGLSFIASNTEYASETASSGTMQWQKFRTKFTLSLASVQSLVSLAACRLIIICYVQVFVQLLLPPSPPPRAELFLD